MPFCGVILAASYDVGYFFGFDISFYSLFSLSEHILFSLEAMPIALSLVVVVFGTVAGIGAFLRLTRSFIYSYSNHYGVDFGGRRRGLFEQNIFGWYFELPWKARLSFWIILAGVEIAASVEIWRLLDYLDANGHIIGLFVGYFAIFTVVALFSTGRLRFALLASAGAIACLFGSFTLGYASSQALKRDSEIHQTLLLQSGPIGGRIVRSGERGVLFIRASDNVLELVRWSQISSITSDRPNLGALGALLKGRKKD